MAAKKLYSSGPKILPEGGGDKNKSAKTSEAKADAEKTAGDPPDKTTETESAPVTEAKGDVMAGTDGIPTHHTQAAERGEVHNRHMLEQKDLLHRHERDHLARSLGHGGEDFTVMSSRHNDERRSMHTRHEQEYRQVSSRHAMPTKNEGKTGTNPE